MITLIIPCYNEQDALPIFYQEVTGVLSGLHEEYELIFVNDGSTDRTLQLLKEFAESDAHVFYLSLSRNFGKEAAMYAGFCNAHGDYVGIMDADMQDPPALLPDMFRLLKSGEYDCVAARRVSRSGEPLVRSWFARKFYQIINRFSEVEIADGARDFRLMRREMADAVVSIKEYNRFSKGIFGWVGFRTCWYPYENVERAAGETKWSFWKLFRYALDGLINSSHALLSFASWCGTAMAVIAFFMLLFVIVRRLCFGDPVAGWASLVCIIIFIGGVQLFYMGIMGQYIAKTYMETKRRPHYIVAESNIDAKKFD